MQQFADPAEAQILALAIVDAIPDPLVVINRAYHIVAANRCFAEAFEADPKQLHDAVLFDLGDKAWDIPALHVVLDKAFVEQVAVDGFELEGSFTRRGQRTIVLNARLIEFSQQVGPMLLLGAKDITDRREIEREKSELLARTSELLAQQKILVREMQHRVANSLQIIASILMLKTRAVTSPEAREHLEDAHKRVLSVAQVQSHLSSAEGIDQIDMAAYLSKLCHGLAVSMISPDKPIDLTFVSSSGGTLDSTRAVSIGLIVTELILNCIKHAFPAGKQGAAIAIDFEEKDGEWMLTVKDNGLGSEAVHQAGTGGLGTAIVAALAVQLEVLITATSSPSGRTVVIGPGEIGVLAAVAA